MLEYHLFAQYTLVKRRILAYRKDVFQGSRHERWLTTKDENFSTTDCTDVREPTRLRSRLSSAEASSQAQSNDLHGFFEAVSVISEIRGLFTEQLGD
jgi:hypothetical protein